MSFYNIEIADPKDFAPVVADEIVLCINEAIEDHGHCSIVLAGGGSPSGIYRLLSRPPRVHDIEWDKVKIFWGDERWVPQDDLQSNYRMANETFISQVPVEPTFVYPVNTTFATPQESAADYDRQIRTALPNIQTEGFDLVLLGIGEDGHTASLFPGQEWDDAAGSLVIATRHPESNTPRISLTLGALKSGKRVMFMLKGDAKADIAKKALELGDPALPVCHFAELSEKLTWFLDSHASSKLKI